MTKELHRRKHQDSEDSWKSWHGRDYNLKISITGNILVGWDVSDAEHGLKTLVAFCTSGTTASASQRSKWAAAKPSWTGTHSWTCTSHAKLKVQHMNLFQAGITPALQHDKRTSQAKTSGQLEVMTWRRSRAMFWWARMLQTQKQGLKTVVETCTFGTTPQPLKDENGRLSSHVGQDPMHISRQGIKSNT